MKALPAAAPPTLNFWPDFGMLKDLAGVGVCSLVKLLIAMAVATLADAFCHGAALPATAGLGAGGRADTAGCCGGVTWGEAAGGGSGYWYCEYWGGADDEAIWPYVGCE